ARTTLGEHPAPVTAVAFARDDTVIASGDKTGVVRVRELSTGRERVELHLDGVVIRQVSLIEEGQRLLVARSDGQVSDMNLSTRSFALHRAHSGALVGAELSRDERRLATVGQG